MGFPQGIYFRLTDNQTDPADYDAEVSLSNNYPRTSAQGNSVGYEDIFFGQTDARDRDVGSVVALRGIHFLPNSSGGNNIYRIDLPSTGSYVIKLALGDEGGMQNCRCRLLDNATQFADIDAATGGAANFIDATGVNRTSQADWVSNNVGITHTFSSTILRIWMGASAAVSGVSCISEIYIAASGGGGGAAASRLSTLMAG